MLKIVIAYQQEEFCTSNLQNFTTHIKRNLVADKIRVIFVVS